MNDSLHISAAGLALEKKYEKGPPKISPRGFATKKYYDDAGLATIGWGHRIVNADDTLHTATIDEHIAEQLLVADNTDAERTVKRLVTVVLTQHEFDALVSFVLNVGSENFRKSTLLRLLNTNFRRSAADQFSRWNKYTDPSCGCLKIANGLTARREDERALFLGVTRA